MLDALGADLETAVALNAEALSLRKADPPSDGRAVLARALRENRDALVRDVAGALAAAWEEAFAAGRAFERSLVPLPAPALYPPPRLVALG